MFMRQFETGFQFLLNQLLNPTGAHELSSILWTGVTPKAGVSTLLLGFTSYLAGEMGQSILLCDANFQNRALTSQWGLENEPGLADILSGKAQPADVIRETDLPGLYVLPGGEIKRFPSVIGSHSRKTKDTLQLLSKRFGLVVMDTASPNSSPETCYLASQVSGVLLVAQAEKTRREVLQSTTDRLESVGANIVGGLLNRRKFHIPPYIYRLLG